MRNSAFIFDLDGTLFDSETQIERALASARSKMGFPILAETSLSALIGLSAKELVRDLRLPESEESELVRVFREELALEILRENPMFTGAREFVEMATALGIKIGVATSKPSYLARHVVQNSGISTLVDFVQGTDQFSAKPDPSVITYCLKELGLASALMFGDRVEDMVAACAAGVIGIGISQTVHTERELFEAGATLVFPSFIKAMGKIQQLAKMVETSK